MRVSQSVEIVWVFDVEYSSFVVPQAREIVTHLPSNIAHKDIAFSHYWDIGSKGTHPIRSRTKDDLSFRDCSSVSRLPFVCVWEQTKRKCCLSRFQALANFSMLVF
jgi:hypothetical protein